MRKLPVLLVVLSGFVYFSSCKKKDIPPTIIEKRIETMAECPIVPTPIPASTVKEYMQIERLARPAVNEGLVISNDFLNAFNSIPPSLDLSEAAAPVRAEAVGTIKAALAALNPTANADMIAQSIAGAFLPDVMRIDVSDQTTAPLGTTAYNFAASSGKGILVGGRKLEDDVVDITLSAVLGLPTNPPAVSDGVSYQGATGNSAQGHKMLNGATSYNSAASFPYLAAPN